MSSLKKNLFYVLLQQFVLIGLPFLTIPYISRVLGPDGVGLYGYSFSIVTLLINIFLLGSNLYAAREIAKVKEDSERLNRDFSEIFWIRFSLLLVAAVLYWISVMTMFDGSIVFYLQGLHLIGAFFDITWLYQGLEQFKKVVTRNISIKLLGFGSVFIFVKDSNDVWLYTFIMGISVVVGNLFLFYKLGQFVSFKMISTWARVREHLYKMFLLFIPAFSAMIYSVLDKTMLGTLSTVDQVGYYEQSYKIVYMITQLLYVTGIVMLPRTSSLIANNQMDKLHDVIKRGLTINFLLVFPLAIGLITISEDFIVWFLGPDFAPSIWVAIVMAPIIIFKSLGVIFGSWYLVPMEMNKEYTIPIVFGAILNVILNFALIPFYGAVGAAIATVSTEGIILLIQIWFLRKVFPFKQMVKESVIKYLAIALLMGALIFGVDLLIILPLFWSILLKVTIGVVFYFLILFLIKDKQLQFILNKMPGSRARG
ncbi:flippase [Bacillus carboniphilus]|uniref:Flippase n=1 Tax=Bacillus carboniphilus TaxID=86663 RepID=A0ABN0VRL2_9BACI